jgi:hypothetical protein
MKTLALAVGVMLSVAACSSAKPCASTCTGCCDAADKCQLGNTPLGCGFGGEVCHVCNLGQTCLGGSCLSVSGSGGGFSSTGGGSGTGGGVGTGGGASTGGGSGTGGGSSAGGGAATGGGSATGGGAGTGGGTSTNRANVMLVVDKSGSMSGPMNPANTNCPMGCGAGNPCPSNCPTRWSELSAGVTTFLSQNAQTARYGAAFFPIDSVCAAATLASVTDAGVDLPTAADSTMLLQAQASAVATRLAQVTPVGGTPTAETLNVFGGYPQLSDSSRHDWVVLLTDGVPNCNPNNPNTCANATACQCTISSCAGTLCEEGCLDVDATAMAEVGLQQHGIKTVVIGVGTDVLTGNGPMTMATMGQAGGYVRTCPFGTNVECSPGTCDTNTHVCSVSYFAITSQTELSQALQTVSTTF